jgi:hypothetical protein
MIEHELCRRAQHVVRSIGDRQPRGLQHLAIVGTVTDRHAIAALQPALGRGCEQARPLGIGTQHRREDPAREPPVHHLEPVALMPLEAREVRHVAGERREPARDQERQGTMRPHRADQCPGTRGEGEALGADLGDRRLRHALEQCHPGLEGSLEVQLAVHGPARDRRHLGLDADEVRELVDALDRDDRAVHVGDQHRLPPPGSRHQCPVDRLAQELGRDGLVRRCRIEHDLNRRIGRQPAQPAAEPAAKALDQR